MRRRRHYDATGVRQRESLMEAADLLRDEGADLGAALRSLHVELVLTAHPTEATRRSVLDHQLHLAELLDGLDDPRIGRSRRRALLLPAARGADHLVADRRGPPRAPDGRGRGAAQPVLLRGDAARRGARGARGARALLRGPRRRPRAVVRLVGRLGHGRPSGGRGRDAGAHAHAAPRDRAAAAAGARRPARPELLALDPPRARLRRARGVARARRGRAAVGPRAAPRQPRVRAAADEAQLHHAPALEHARPARARARATPTRRSCATTSGWCSRASARRTSRTAACAGSCGRSTCSASTWRASTCASRRRSCRTRSRRCCPATATPARTSGCGCSRRRSPSSGAAWTAARPARPASCCACSTRSRSRARRTASARCP